jgi:TetR/AcrR family transcriptional regulator, regulator of biofilm formation and stress response
VTAQQPALPGGRGERTRQSLVRATLAIIERDGICGVTHRNVTREAGLPATSAAYHFASITDLLEQALLTADRQAADALDEIGRADDPVAALSRWLALAFTEERSRLIAEYELYLYAARAPSMRPTASRWLTHLESLVSTWSADTRRVRTVCAYVDGLLLQALVAGTAPDPEEMAAAIRDVL